MYSKYKNKNEAKETYIRLYFIWNFPCRNRSFIRLCVFLQRWQGRDHRILFEVATGADSLHCFLGASYGIFLKNLSRLSEFEHMPDKLQPKCFIRKPIVENACCWQQNHILQVVARKRGWEREGKRKSEIKSDDTSLTIAANVTGHTHTHIHSYNIASHSNMDNNAY